ncbi:MAG: L-threonylcarbamoyladenylate synthase [Bacteroidota bacterium]
MMQTDIIPVDSSNPDPSIIGSAVAVLRGGGLVAFPTETVYGLGADAFNVEAVKKVFLAKGRPADNPLIIHIALLEMLGSITERVPPIASRLAEAFWPGPLTLVLYALPGVPGIVTANLQTAAVRFPNHPVALAMIKEFGRGIVAPSANLSGRPSPTTAKHVKDDLNGKIDMILDAGPSLIGVESTVLDITVDPPVILREGGLVREQIEGVIGRVATTEEHEILRRSPGTRYRHYAPKARVILIPSGNKEEFLDRIKKSETQGKIVGSIVHSVALQTKKRQIRLSGDPTLYAKEFFSALRAMDEQGVEVLLVEGVAEEGIGAAVMERLRKAAGD